MNAIVAEHDHDHVVQFYETDGFLARLVAPFLAANLRRGGVGLLICTFEHLLAITRELLAAGLDVPYLRRRRLLVWIDARLLLAAVLSQDPAVELELPAEVTSAVSGAAARTGGRAPHVYGELVDLLWAQGRADVALRLEAQWNRFARDHDFELLCAYRVSPHDHGPRRLDAICAAHSHVLRPERALGVRVLDDPRVSTLREGERDMVHALRHRDQQLADQLRHDLAQGIVGIMVQVLRVEARLPASCRKDLPGLLRPPEQALHLSLSAAHELAPVQLEMTSLAEAVRKYAAMIQRMFDVVCHVAVGRTFRDPERSRRELIYSILRDVLDRAARERGAREIEIRLAGRRSVQRVSIYHDGDNLELFGSGDDEFRRLIYQARVLGNKIEIRRGARRSRGAPQIACRWQD